jgi:hypothetical protein
MSDRWLAKARIAYKRLPVKKMTGNTSMLPAFRYDQFGLDTRQEDTI